MNSFYVLLPVVSPAEAFGVPLARRNRAEEHAFSVNCPLMTLEVSRVGEVDHSAARNGAFVGSLVLVHMSSKSD